MTKTNESKADIKLRFLRIMDILNTYSDEDSPLTANDIISKLESQYNIICDRKTIYSAIDSLEEYGLDIVKSSSPKGYFIGSREFELPEVRLLIDAVQSANFISSKKTKVLLNKLSKLTSINQFKKLEKQVHIDARNKTTNENLFYVIDALDNAISSNLKVSVLYRRRNISVDKKTHFEEKTYTLSPYCLIWYDDHYYLVANNEKYDNLMHLRIDRIKSVVILEEKTRHYSEVSQYKTKFNAADYSNKHLSMFSGESRPIDLICKSSIIEEVLDKFGEKISLQPIDDEIFSARVYAAVNQGLVNWIIQYGDSIKVKSPTELVEMIKDKADKIINTYR